MTAPITPDLIIAELRVLPTQDRLLGLYELAIDGCQARDVEPVRAALIELIASLDFTYVDIAEAFHDLYVYCLAQARLGAFERVVFVLHDLRGTLIEPHADTLARRAASA